MFFLLVVVAVVVVVELLVHVYNIRFFVMILLHSTHTIITRVGGEFNEWKEEILM